MAPQAEVAKAFLVTSANFGGGVTSTSLLGEAGAQRVAGLSHLLADPSGQGSGALGMPGLLAIQEMIRLPGRDDPLDQLLARLLSPSEHFAAVTSTARYPLPSKWERRWNTDGPLDVVEGLAVVAPHPVALRPATDDHDDPPRHSSHGRVIDLPILEFWAHAEERVAPGDSWLRAPLPWETNDASPEIIFRPTYYQGSRDTDPRAATAHIARFPVDDASVAVAVVNVHLGTLRSEDAGDMSTEVGDELAFSLRRPTVEAMYLRHRQFQVLAEFVAWVYRRLRIPVIVLGDFNCEPTSPEMTRFCEQAHLVPALQVDTCWRCGASPARPKQRRYANDSFTMIRRVGEPLRGDAALHPVTTDAYCGVNNCTAPLFTHKRNLSLLDNILVSDVRSRAARTLSANLTFAAVAGTHSGSGINDTHAFSDHNSVWATLAPVGA